MKTAGNGFPSWNSDEEAKRLWSWFREASLNGSRKVYDMLTFTSTSLVTFSAQMMDKPIQILEKGFLVKSQSAEIVDLKSTTCRL